MSSFESEVLEDYGVFLITLININIRRKQAELKGEGTRKVAEREGN